MALVTVSPGAVLQARAATVSLHTHANARSELDTQVLFGERVTVLARRRGWLRARSHLDGKEGFVRAELFSTDLFKPTHRVCVPHTPLQRFRPVQSQFLGMLGMNALVRVIDTSDRFARLSTGAWIHQSALMPVSENEPDVVDVAMRFTGAPYLWGGRTGVGLDCSAMIQAACIACGIESPRDSSQQIKVLGASLPLETSLQRGDLVFWCGHVGIMVSRTHILNANDAAMAVVIEPLDYLVARRKREELPEKQEIVAIRRLVL